MAKVYFIPSYVKKSISGYFLRKDKKKVLVR